MEILFKLHSEKKHSRRYKATDEDAPIQDIYVRRPYSERKAEITLVIKDEISDA